MRRGFKAEAERRAMAVRKDMGLAPSAVLDARDLAKHVGVRVVVADELVSLARLNELDELQPGAFSACTFDLSQGKVVVLSPFASPERSQSDIAHEVAHLILEHDVKTVERVGEFTFFACDKDEEQEANWLAGCLLLPRQLLVAALRRGRDSGQIAALSGVSLQMAEYRIRATGVMRQMSRRATG